MKAKVIMLPTKVGDEELHKRGAVVKYNNYVLGGLSGAKKDEVKIVDQDTLNSVHWTRLDLYLIDPNAEIKGGDWVYCKENDVVVRQSKFESDSIDFVKIIATTCKSLNLLQLSVQSIKLLVDYYNKENKMPDEVEIETYTDHMSFCGLDLSTEEIKLNPQRMIDITIPKEINYTLINDFTEHPNWCKENGLNQFNDLKLGQLVFDLNKTLARIVHVSKEGNFRLNLINETGEFASVTSNYDSLILYKGQKVTIPEEKMYSREEVERLIFKFGALLWDNEYAENPEEEDTNMNEIFKNWVLENL